MKRADSTKYDAVVRRLGIRLRRIRQAQSETLQGVAKKAGFKSHGSIFLLERGKSMSLSGYLAMASALEVKLSDLLRELKC